MAEFKNLNHSLIQLFALAACALLFACSKGESNESTGENKGCPKGAVDLGIVITREDGTTYNLYWAKTNLCESGLSANPEYYGDYYAWGETESKSNYAWSTYKFAATYSGPFSKYNTNSSYGTVDNKTVLDTGEKGDDAASKILGGKWRMPTSEEWAALLENSQLEWTSDYNGTGVAGMIATSTVEGYTDKSLFFPATGRTLGSSVSESETVGFYWTSRLSSGTDPAYADAAHLSNGSYFTGKYYRSSGNAVRPVIEE